MKSFYTFILLLICLYANAGGYSLSGVVTDSETKAPLLNVNISIVDMKIGATSRDDGSFVIDDIPEGNYRLLASAIGYDDLEEVRPVFACRRSSVDLRI
ncbi:MAG: carboxypeptidase-like regulatory domain-containing protein [Mangrovibacterium sp.]